MVTLVVKYISNKDAVLLLRGTSTTAGANPLDIAAGNYNNFSKGHEFWDGVKCIT